MGLNIVLSLYDTMIRLTLSLAGLERETEFFVFLHLEQRAKSILFLVLIYVKTAK